ncbi:cyclic pyranopterin monophosphate synthase MoaC [Asticcacaulis excentricus]|uniref:Cyclic pyranopterin monophosphate synthase n=1 Tax=Asticcacaulis excentricus (strain ATCC 15261 / DSM 4724 / KCTC 12464 / NCIMB 9791 / VKM B-1370 / CB 48) TaxID=573065 RepID=E8RLC0_ASTEC|nr:cyclic pyranopterin monophosphate synthase MoaC [Asticcacaulis excentricus]ADU12610.1 molybdenum cofactor biosynthesis protein C [Asticcacaulis excentricus CB 48]
MSENSLSHVGKDGRAHMVDVGAKAFTARKARAEGRLFCAGETLAIVRDGRAPKGAVISTAEIAGIMAAKKTADLIPMCHPLSLSKVGLEIVMDETLPGFRLSAEVRTSGQTGVEMEALTAVSVAALTLYDMLKAVDKTMRIDGIEVVAKAGGKADYGY